MIQFPEKFQERMQQMLGDEEYAEFLKSYDLPFHNGLRINTWKTKTPGMLQRMGVDLKQVPWNETGFYLENKKQFFKNILIIKEGFIIFRRPAHAAGKACECTAWGEDSGYVCGTGRQKYGHRCSLKG